jgi:parallel beta-helix repeat protein
VARLAAPGPSTILAHACEGGSMNRRAIAVLLLGLAIACTRDGGAAPAGGSGGGTGGGAGGGTAPGGRYVAADGDDRNPGTEALPWRTIQKAFDAARPGETVYIKEGTYHERPAVHVSGDAVAGPITFRSFENHLVVLDGTGTEALAPYLVTVVDRSHVRIVGLVLTHNVLDQGGGILVAGTGQDVEVRDCRISDIRSPGAGAGTRTHPLIVAGTDLRGVVISGNEIFDVTTGDSEALLVTCNVSDFVVADNHVHDNDAAAIDVAGGYAWCPDRAAAPPRNGAIRGNLVERAGTPPYGGGAIYVDGGRDLVVERNVVRSSTTAFQVLAEQPAPAGEAARIVIRDNLAQGNTAGVVVGEWPGYLGVTHDVEIVGNTIHENVTGVRLNPAAGVVLRNNIVSSNAIQLLNQADGIPVAATLDFNLYWGSGAFYWGSTVDMTFERYRAVSLQDGSSLFADPGFVRTTPDVDLSLSPTSSARDRGDPGFTPAA